MNISGKMLQKYGGRYGYRGLRPSEKWGGLSYAWKITHKGINRDGGMRVQRA